LVAVDPRSAHGRPKPIVLTEAFSGKSIVRGALPLALPATIDPPREAFAR